MNPYAILALVLFLVTVAFRYFLKFKNVAHLKKHGNEIPDGFEGHIDEELLRKTMAYSVENSRFGYITSIFSNILLIVFIFGGLLNLYNSWIVSFNWPFILSSILFFLFLSYINTILTIPFDLYETFKIENKYGFNTQTPKLWVLDFIKSLILSTIIFGILGTGIFWLIQSSPNWWWLFAWGFVFIFSLFMMYISPYVIEPLFNKYEPVKVEGLEHKIKNLMQKAGIKVSRVFQMDASKRSKHTNAYFSGIGKTKRIVLFDTLIEKMNQNEILAVLAHEAGHWKKKHILKSIILFEITSLISFYITFLILKNEMIYNIFEIQEATLPAGLIVISFLAGIVTFPFSPAGSFLSRRREKQADQFACELVGNSDGLVSSLIKLSKDNLANLHPHPWFAAFYYSHPPIVSRIKYLQEFNLQKTETSNPE